MPCFQESTPGREEQHQSSLHSFFYLNHQIWPHKELPRPGLTLIGEGWESGKWALLLLSLQREVKMEPVLPGDHSGSSHHLALWGTEDGLPHQVGGGISKSPPEQCSTEVSPGPEHLMSPGEEVTVPRPSGLLPLSTLPWGRTSVLRHHPLGIEKGVPCMTLLGLRPAGGCTLPGQRTFSPRPRSGQRSGTCEEVDSQRLALLGPHPVLGPCMTCDVSLLNRATGEMPALIPQPPPRKPS